MFDMSRERDITKRQDLNTRLQAAKLLRVRNDRLWQDEDEIANPPALVISSMGKCTHTTRLEADTLNGRRSLTKTIESRRTHAESSGSRSFEICHLKARRHAAGLAPTVSSCSKLQ